MRHRADGRKLGRTTAHRGMLLRNLVTSLILHEQIVTTVAKAKELRRIADRMITLGKRGDLHARRLAARLLLDEAALRKLFDGLAARFADRPGGYTRITKLRPRMGDGAPMAAIEFIGAQVAPKPRRAKKAEAPAPGPTAPEGAAP